MRFDVSRSSSVNAEMRWTDNSPPTLRAAAHQQKASIDWTSWADIFVRPAVWCSVSLARCLFADISDHSPRCYIMIVAVLSRLSPSESISDLVLWLTFPARKELITLGGKNPYDNKLCMNVSKRHIHLVYKSGFSHISCTTNNFTVNLIIISLLCQASSYPH